MNSIANEALNIMNNKLDLKVFGSLLNEQWKLKKKLSNKVSNKLIDNIYIEGLRNGAYGCKLLGAGNGGFLMFICNSNAKIKLIQKFKKFLHIPIRFDTIGSQIIYFSK